VSGYAPAALAAAACDVTGRYQAAGRVAAGGAALLGPGVASYTAVLLSNTAVPAWHEARAEMPFLFTASAASAAAGLGLITAADSEVGPVCRLAVAGAVGELAAGELMLRGMDPAVRRGYDHGRAHVLLTASKALAATGAAAAVPDRGPSGRQPASRCSPPRPAPGSASSMPGSAQPTTRRRQSDHNGPG
jgi:hypothetical protein